MALVNALIKNEKINLKGHGKAVLDRANLILSFGRMTLPHFLMRVVLAEQLYRAKTLWDGHPYHRD